MKKVLVVGASSAIAEAVARIFSGQGAKLYLLARNSEKLASLEADLLIRGAASVHSEQFDINEHRRHEEMLNTVSEVLGGIDVALVAHGTLGNQQECEQSPDLALQELQTNAVSTIAFLTRLGNLFEKQGRGTIVVISSVAGDRGRPSNYVYGTAKAAVTTFCEGLNARLFKAGVHVMTVKPGIVATPMTEGLDMPGVLVAQPEQVAADIVRAMEKKIDTLYTPWFWKYIMAGIVHIPTSFFKKLNL
jgi:short-subunit dehydrogenase